MKSITIHNLDDPLERRIMERAKKDGKSLNKTIKTLLSEALGIRQKKKPDNREEFADLCGAWSKAEAKAFMKAAADFEKIDAEDWA